MKEINVIAIYIESYIPQFKKLYVLVYTWGINKNKSYSWSQGNFVFLFFSYKDLMD